MSKNIKTLTILFDMVTVDFFDHRNYDRDYRADNLAIQLRKELNRPNDLLVERYSELFVYTDNMEFDWLPDAPEAYRALETWWEMAAKGKPQRECYMFYIENVANPVTTSYDAAMREVHTPWRPAEARPDEFLTPEELADPNSPSVVVLNGMSGDAGSEI